ncbi:hypothetical protein [Streptomyces sp. NPDC059761]|uniref:hypothetical protein n=1 Tax=Streptomyces sp. NPDC059761 TaxID=3346937 RepID=UPI0036478E04
MTHTDRTPQEPHPDASPSATEPTPSPGVNRGPVPDAVMLIALLTACAGVYLTVGDTGFAGVISAVAGLFGTWRMRR